MAKDILKEAIADAKAVREVALANAKAALEEAFTPKLQSMLSAKLSEDLNEDDQNEGMYYDEDEKDEDMKEMYYDEDEKDEDMKEMYHTDEDEKDEDMKESDLDEEIDLEEILNELELEESEEVSEEKVDEGKDEADEDMKEGKDDIDEDIEEAVGYPNYRADQITKVKADATDVNQGLNEGEEFDLDALLEEINNLEEKKDEADEDMKEAKMDDDKDKMEESEETNEVVGTVAAGIAGVIAAAGGLTALEMAADDPEFKAKYPKVARALDKLQDIGKAAADAKRMEESAIAEELEETKTALEAVKSELNEVNLLNSKLLYVNRIFKANTLDESQKLRVVETLDKAETAKEAKLIYETIKDTFNVAKSKKESFKNKTKSLKEGIGMASKAAGTSTAPKKEVIAESNNMVNRFQKLANITIKE